MLRLVHRSFVAEYSASKVLLDMRSDFLRKSLAEYSAGNVCEDSYIRSHDECRGGLFLS